MTTKKLGKQTVAFASPPSIAGHANVVGKKEGEGPLRASFDLINQDDTFGESSWEKAESAMQKLALQNALDKAKQAASTLDFIFAGDLLNQCIASSFAIRGQGVPFFGLYGACSTMAESLTLASMMLDGGFGEWAAAMASSHFPAGIWRTAYPHRPMDGHGCRRGRPGARRRWPLYYPCNCGKNRRQGDQGRQ